MGGGPGRYAAWLGELGYVAHMVDPVPLHVEQATALAERTGIRFTTSVGDAGHLEDPDASRDVVLMLGPLYHLVERGDRMRALSEALRVVRPGGLVAVAAISRFASLLEGLRNGYLGDPRFDAIVERDLRDGFHRNPTAELDFFTNAYFHHPGELAEEVTDAGLRLEGVFGIEGPGWLLWELWDDPQGRESILRVARAVEQEPALLGASGHLLAIARRRG